MELEKATNVFVDVNVPALKHFKTENIPAFPVHSSPRLGSPTSRAPPVLLPKKVESKKVLNIVDQRWIYARLVGNMTKLFPPVQFPSQDQL